MNRFPPDEIAIKIALSLGLGLLVGLEREWAHKDLGVRTFTITALLGLISALLGPQFSIASMVGIFLVIAAVNGRSILKNRSLETTTSVALLVTLLLGVLVGQGHLFTPVATVIIMTMLLAWKTELHRLAGGLTRGEVRGAVLLGLLGFVVYPVLPDLFVDRWQLINPQETWTIVIVIAGISFANYVLLRLYSAKGIYYSAILGGLVNSTATVAEMLAFLTSKSNQLHGLIIPVVMLTVTAMSFRNLLILSVFAPQTIPFSLAPMLLMAGPAALFAWRNQTLVKQEVGNVSVSSPISLQRVLKYGALFVLIQIAATLSQRFLGEIGFVGVSFVGGLASSASTTAAAASLVTRDGLSNHGAVAATIVATAASAIVNIPLVYRYTRERSLVLRLATASIMVAVLGLGVILVELTIA